MKVEDLNLDVYLKVNEVVQKCRRFGDKKGLADVIRNCPEYVAENEALREIIIEFIESGQLKRIGTPKRQVTQEKGAIALGYFCEYAGLNYPIERSEHEESGMNCAELAAAKVGVSGYHVRKTYYPQWDRYMPLFMNKKYWLENLQSQFFTGQAKLAFNKGKLPKNLNELNQLHVSFINSGDDCTRGLRSKAASEGLFFKKLSLIKESQDKSI